MEWISLVERTPEHGMEVYIKNAKGKEARVDVAICKNGELYFYFPAGKRRFTPTHWMPLPDHPDSSKR